MNPNDAISTSEFRSQPERVRVWVGHMSVDDPQEPFEAVIRRREEDGSLVLVGRSLNFWTTYEKGPYYEFLRETEDGDFYLQERYVMNVEPMLAPEPSEPPELPTYVYWEPERRGGGVWDVLVWCPECEKEHRHGGGRGDVPSLGHRVAHCMDEIGSAYRNVGYMLANPEPIPERCEQGHLYISGTIEITAKGLRCATCEKARVKAERKAAKQRRADTTPN